MSLAKCLKKAGLSKHEAAILRGAAADLEYEGLQAQKAAIRAVRNHIAGLEEERADIVRQIEAAGGVVTEVRSEDGSAFPERTADTMSDAIALSSPDGRMSKRAREEATKRLGEKLFGKGGATREQLMGGPVKQPTERDRLLEQAKRLRELADRGMSVKKFTLEAEKLEAQAKEIERQEGGAVEGAKQGASLVEETNLSEAGADDTSGAVETRETDRGTQMYSGPAIGPSRSTGASPATIRSALVRRFGERLIKALEDARILKIVATAADIRGIDVDPRARGVYDDNLKVGYLIADKLTKHTATQVLLHEIGEHHGLETFLGEKGWRALATKVRLMAKREGSQADAVWDSVKANYTEFRGRTDADLSRDDRFMHEVVAALGETQAFRQTSVWRDIVTAVKAFLLKHFGFSGTLSDDDIGRILEGSLQHAARTAGIPTQAEAALADDLDQQTAFLEEEARRRGFPSVDDFIAQDMPGFMAAAEKWREQHALASIQPATGIHALISRFTESVRRVLRGPQETREPITLSETTPASLRVFGWSELPVVVRPGGNGIAKMYDVHGMSESEIGRLVPEALQRPALMLQNVGQHDVESVLFVSRKSGEKPIIVAVHPERAGQAATGPVHLVATMLEKDEGWSYVSRNISRGNLLYRDTDAALPGMVRLAISEAQKKYTRQPRSLLGLIPNRAPVGEYAYKVLSQGDLVKWESENQKDDSDWSGRLTFPDSRRSSAEPPGPSASQDSTATSPQRAEVQTEHFDVTDEDARRQGKPTGKQPTVTVKKKRGPLFSIGLGDLDARQRTAVESVLGRPPTLIDRAKQFRGTWAKSMTQGLVDQFAPIKELSERAYMLARMSKGGDSTLESAFLYGKVSVDAQGFYQSEYTDQARTEGFAGKMAKLRGEHDRFLLWMAAKRAELLTREERENLFSGASIAALKTLADGKMRDGTTRLPLYEQAERDLNEFNNSFLKIARDSKLISQELHDYLKDRPYVPFYRMVEDGAVQGFGNITPGLVGQYFSKRLKGGAERLNEDLLANVLKNWSHVITASARNRAALLTLRAAERVGAAERVDPGYHGKDRVRFMGDIRLPDGSVRHGEVVYRVTDPHLLDAVTSLEYAGLGAWAKPFVTAKRWLTIGVTANPAFKIRNLIRDSISAIGTSDLSYNPLSNVAKGWSATGKDSATRAQMLAAGGMIRFGSMLDGTNSSRAQRLIDLGVDPDNILDSDTKIERFWKHRILPAIEAYQEFGDRGEQVNRAALYLRLVEKGMSHGEAAFWARDLMDFSMSGKWAAVRTLTQVVPFMNARLQGLYKLGRATRQDWRRMAYTVGAVSLASIALLLAYKDDEDWKRRPDWDRDNYWWFKVGDTAVRLPKPFEIGAIGTLAERGLELWLSDEMTGERFGRSMRDLVSNQLSMNPMPQLVKPLVDLYANKDSFSGRTIEGMGMEHMRPEDRATARTSQVARFLGSLGLPQPLALATGRYAPLSPVQIDHLARAYFGWLGTATTTALDYGIRPMVERGERPAMQLRDVFLAGNFVEGLPSGSSRYVNDLYEQAKEIEEAYGSYRAALKRGDTEKAAEIKAEEGDKLARYRGIEGLKRKMSELNQLGRRVESDPDMSAAAKREELTRLDQLKDRLARRAVAR